jgi:hypothetical protein
MCVCVCVCVFVCVCVYIDWGLPCLSGGVTEIFHWARARGQRRLRCPAVMGHCCHQCHCCPAGERERSGGEGEDIYCGAAANFRDAPRQPHVALLSSRFVCGSVGRREC